MIDNNSYLISSSGNTCIENDQTDCMEINDNITVVNNEICPTKNTIEMIFDYNLHDTINCAITKREPIKYNFDIVCKFEIYQINMHERNYILVI